MRLSGPPCPCPPHALLAHAAGSLKRRSSLGTALAPPSQQQQQPLQQQQQQQEQEQQLAATAPPHPSAITRGSSAGKRPVSPAAFLRAIERFDTERGIRACLEGCVHACAHIRVYLV